MKRPSFLSTKTLLATCAILAANAAHADPIAEIVGEIVGTDAPGLAVLVTRDGEVVHMEGYGYADLDTETPMAPTSIFDLASVSKQMTAMAAHLQISDGLYLPETNVGELLPAFEANIEEERPIVVLDLIHHLSGLPDYLSGDLDYGSETTNAEVVDWLAQSEADAEPGTEFSYSNSGYLTLGSVIAAAEDTNSLEEVLEARIWGPLGMTSTTLVEPASEDEAVTGYSGTDGEFETASEPNISEGDGNVFSSVSDLALYEAWLAENGMLPEMHPIFRNGSLDDGTAIDDGEGAGYGFGWYLEEMNDADYAYHSGSWTGTSTYYQRNLVTGVSVILLANGEDADLGELALEIEAAFE